MPDEEIEMKLLKIGEQVNHMTSLLEDVLTLGKSEVGAIKVNHTEIDLKEFIAGLVEEVAATLKVKRAIQYSYSAKHRLVEVDQKLMRNIVINLLTNALKFSPDDKAVSITVKGDIETLTIEVTDKGIGIKEEELNTIFEAFQRGTNVSAIEGTGLGLSILKKAVELMKGTIQVESKVNEGSCFTVNIPVA
jgi:signal transduction histidine kinase